MTAAPEQEEVQAESETQESPVLEEITKEEIEEVAEPAIEASKTRTLPESVEKLVEFINETGGTVQDYVNLNRDYSEMDNLTALQEYYKTTKPHLSSEERAFLMEEKG